MAKHVIDVPDIQLGTDLERIRQNNLALKRAQNEVSAAQKLIQALRAANVSMCSHPNRKVYHDPRDPGGWDCQDCGGCG